MRIQSNSKGFTLLEILIVLIILGVIAGIAIPAFSSQVEKSRAQEAYQNLTHLKEAENRYYTKTLAYVAVAANVACNSSAQVLDFNPYCTATGAQQVAAATGPLFFDYACTVAGTCTATRAGAGQCGGSTIVVTAGGASPTGTGCFV